MTRALWVVEARNAYDPATGRRSKDWHPTEPSWFTRAQARRRTRFWRAMYGGVTRVVRYIPMPKDGEVIG